ARHLRAPGAFGHPPVDAFGQHRQLRGRHRNHAILRLWPHKPATIETFGIENEPLTVPPKDLQQVTAPPATAEKLAAERVLAELLRDQCRQPAETLPHVGHACRQPDPHTRRWCHHPRSAARTRRRLASPTPSSILIRQPSLSSISIRRGMLGSICSDGRGNAI